MSEHVALWIDHKEARIFRIRPDGSDEASVKAPTQLHHKHPKGPEGVKEHPDDAKRFFHEIERSLEGTEVVLVMGPSTAKFEFLKYVHEHDHGLESRVIGVETVDHPTGGQLVAYAKKYFKLKERIW